MNSLASPIDDEDDPTIEEIFESLETSLWLADAYHQRGALELRNQEIQSVRELLDAYGDTLREEGYPVENTRTLLDTLQGLKG